MPLVPLKTHTISLGEWAVKYLNFSKSKHSEKTYQEKRRCLKRFFTCFSKEMSVEDIDIYPILTFLQEQNDNRSGNAANKDRKHLIAAWNWGVKYLSIPTTNHFATVDRFPETRKPRYVPPLKDFWKAYDAAHTDQDRTMLLCYLHLAARRSEVFDLIWNDIDFNEGQVRLYSQKNKDGSREASWLPMSNELHSELHSMKNGSAGNDFVFLDPQTGFRYYQRRHWMKNICRRAGVKHFGMHAIRHMTASILAQAGAPMIEIQTILRHGNLRTTEIYIRKLTPTRSLLDLLPQKQKTT